MLANFLVKSMVGVIVDEHASNSFSPYGKDVLSGRACYLGTLRKTSAVTDFDSVLNVPPRSGRYTGEPGPD